MRIILNKPMAGMCASYVQDVNLPASLDRSLEQASFVKDDGCYFLSNLFHSRGNACLSSFPDETGYECYVNHMHIDPVPNESPFLQALRVLSLVEEKWLASAYDHLVLRHIISCDDTACVYRCHVVRQGQSWLAEDLDEYGEPVLVAESERDH